MKAGRLAFLVSTSPVLFMLAGCEERSQSTDSSWTETTSPVQARSGWVTSYEQAQQEAQASHKLMLLDFTGSDWCGWCKLLDREVFSKAQFKEYASKNLVLVELDFPKMKRLSDSIRAQNLLLARRYQVQGFPTIIVLNDEGKKVGELGYMEGGADAFIAELERLRKG